MSNSGTATQGVVIASLGSRILAADEVMEASGIPVPDENEDEVEKFREFLDTVTPEDFGGDAPEPGAPPS